MRLGERGSSPPPFTTYLPTAMTSHSAGGNPDPSVTFPETNDFHQLCARQTEPSVKM